MSSVFDVKFFWQVFVTLLVIAVAYHAVLGGDPGFVTGG